MEKAILSCPKEKVFFRNLLVEKYIVPSKEFVLSESSKLKVNILEVVGEKALVLLPNMRAKGEQKTALIDLNYLE